METQHYVSKYMNTIYINRKAFNNNEKMHEIKQVKNHALKT
jgi:hypothetical protein